MTKVLPAPCPLPLDVVWSTRVSDTPRDTGKLFIGSDRVITNTTTGAVCLDLKNGQTLWRIEEKIANALIVSDHVFVSRSYHRRTRSSTFTGYSLETGERLWNWDRSGTVLDTAIVGTEILILGSDSTRCFWSLESGTGRVNEEDPRFARAPDPDAVRHIFMEGSKLWTAGGACFRDGRSVVDTATRFFYRRDKVVGTVSGHSCRVFIDGVAVQVFHVDDRPPTVGAGHVAYFCDGELVVSDWPDCDPKWSKAGLDPESSIQFFAGYLRVIGLNGSTWLRMSDGVEVAGTSVSGISVRPNHTFWYQNGLVVQLRNGLTASSEVTTDARSPSSEQVLDNRLPLRLVLSEDVGHSDFLIAVTQLNGNEVEGLRDHVTAENLPWLVDAYWKLNTWPMRAAMMELLQDQDRELIRPIADDLLRGPEMLGHQMEIAVAIVSGHTNREIMSSDELYERCHREWRETENR